MKRTKFNGQDTNFYEHLGRTEKAKMTKIERDIQLRTNEIKKHVYGIGELLCKAKKILPHGSFELWRERTFGDDLPYSTAYLYKRIYEEFKDTRGAISLIPIKYMLTLTQKKFPAKALQIIKNKLAKKPDDFDEWQLEQVAEFFDLMKEGTVGGNKFLQQVKQIIKDGKDLNDEKLKNKKTQTKKRFNTNGRRALNFGLIDLLKKLDTAINQAHELAGLFPFDPNDKEHQKVIKLIHTISEKLQKLEIELTGGAGMFKPVSTKNGEAYI